MYDLQKVANICMAELDAIGVKYGTIDKFEINTRAYTRWGQCKILPNGHYSINISKFLLDERNPIIGLKETLMHELCHSVAGCMNHKQPWNNVVAKVNRAYGYNIKRTNSAADKCLNAEVTKERNNYKKAHKRSKSTKQYCIVCSKCGYKHFTTRMSASIQHPENYTHISCGGTFKRLY